MKTKLIFLAVGCWLLAIGGAGAEVHRSPFTVHRSERDTVPVTKRGITPPRNLQNYDASQGGTGGKFGQVMGVRRYSSSLGDTMVGYLPLYVLSGSELWLGSYEVLHEGNVGSLWPDSTRLYVGYYGGSLPAAPYNSLAFDQYTGAFWWTGSDNTFEQATNRNALNLLGYTGSTTSGGTCSVTPDFDAPGNSYRATCGGTITLNNATSLAAVPVRTIIQFEARNTSGGAVSVVFGTDYVDSKNTAIGTVSLPAGQGYTWVFQVLETPASVKKLVAITTPSAGGGGVGTVTSVGLSMPTGFSVGGSPVTSSGTLAVTTTLNGPLRGNGSGFTTGNTALGSEVSGTLPATNGGTGHASYAVGDLLYASTTTALAKLAGVATGNALLSGGVGTAPAWGKIGLTTHVSGTLPIANGGTNLTAYTTGDLIYASATNVLGKLAAGDNGNVLTLAAGVPTWSAPTGGITGSGTIDYFPIFTSASAIGNSPMYKSGNILLQAFDVAGSTSFRHNNTHSAAAASAFTQVGVDGGVYLRQTLYNSLTGSSGLSAAHRGVFESSGSGGFVIAASHAAGKLIFASGGIGGGNARMYIHEDGLISLGTSANNAVDRLQVTGSAIFSATVKFADGSVGTPGIAFSNNIDVGLYRPTTNTLGFTVGGTEEMRLLTTGLQIGTAGSNQGNLLLTGSTSGTVTVTTAAAAGTWSLTLPTTAGSSGQALQTNGSGVTTWATYLTAEVDGSTSNELQNVSYTASTRAVAISSGTGFTFPLFTSTEAGLAPLSGGGTANYLRADGTWAAPPGSGGAPGGSTTHVQYNNAGAFGGSANFTFDGTNVSVANPVYYATGSSGAPSISFTGDTNLGIYRAAADDLAIAAGGGDVLRIKAAGLGIGVVPSLYVLDISSTNAIRLPNGTTAQRPTIAAALLRYNSSLASVEWSDGSSWFQLPAGAAALGTGAANRVTYWTGTTTISSDADFGFDGTTVSVANPMTFSAGSASLPSLVPTGDANNGWWFPSADVQAWSTAGTERMRLGSTGILSLTNSSINTLLTVTGSFHSFAEVTAPNGGGNAGIFLQNSADANNSWLMKRAAGGDFELTQSDSYPFSADNFVLAASKLRVTVQTDVLNIEPVTATVASAVTPTNGDIVYVSSTNGTFTSVGFWGYEAGAWVKL